LAFDGKADGEQFIQAEPASRVGLIQASNSMEELAFTNGSDFFRFSAELETQAALPSRGDARISVQVKSADFETKNDVWVVRDALVAFCRDLASLERSRRGEAKLVSISPGELEVSVRAVSSLGAIAVGGVCGYSVHRPHGQIWHRLEFGFEFDPSQFIGAVAVPWVRRHAV
jgi:hypothetical protein